MRSGIVRFLLVLFICSTIPQPSRFDSSVINECKREISTQNGKTFLITFSTLDLVKSFDCVIYIGSVSSGSVNITQHHGSSSTKEIKRISPGINQVNISTTNLVQETNGIQKKVILIKSTVDISVYMTGYANGVAAAYTVFPEITWSTSYVASAFTTYSSYRPHVVMVSNIYRNASVQIMNKKLNIMLNTSLQPHESYTLKSLNDSSGTIIQSNKPVSIVFESLCVGVPVGFSGCDTLMDSTIPSEHWETEFIIPPLLPKLGYLIRVFAKAENEIVRIMMKNRTNTINQTFTGMIEILLGTDALVIVADKKVNVVQYGFSQKYDNIDGDAFMASVPALPHYGQNYFIPTPFAKDGFANTIIVTIRSVHLPGLLLNGKPIDSKNIMTVTPVAPYDDFRIIFLNLTSGNYNLSHPATDAKYSVLLYGRKYSNGFGLYLGYTFKTAENKNCSQSECSNDGNNDVQCKAAPPRPTCFSCDYTSGLSFCDEIMTCSENQTCFVQSFTNLNGHTHYRSGCIDDQTCRNNEHENNSKGTCLQCCDGNFCNSHGCGDAGFPPRQSRGPLCLDCSHVSHPKDCDKITICSSNEVCRIEEFPWGDNAIFHLGCASVNDCVVEHGFLNSFHQRSVPVCTQCCTEDYCNKNCTGSYHNQQQIIVG